MISWCKKGKKKCNILWPNGPQKTTKKPFEGKMWVDSIFLWAGFDLVMVWLCLVLWFDKVFFQWHQKGNNNNKKVFCSIDNQEKSLKKHWLFYFSSGSFQIFYLSCIGFLHCGTYMRLCLIAYECSVVSFHTSLPIYVFPLYAWLIFKKKGFLNCIKFMSTVNFA